MEDKIKTAADNMLSKGDITQDEHDILYKTAFNLKSVFSLGKKIPPTKAIVNKFLVPLALIGTGVAATKEIIIDPLIESNKINRSFAAMTEKVPQLAEQDQNQIKDYFNVIKTFSPKSASNPLVAGALVNKMMQFGGVDHKLVQDLSAIQAGLPAPRTAPTVVESVAKAVGTSIVPKEKTIAAIPEEKV